jgi:hypothetical protein
MHLASLGKRALRLESHYCSCAETHHALPLAAVPGLSFKLAAAGYWRTNARFVQQ